MINKKIMINIGENLPEGELTTYIMDNSVELYDGKLRPLIFICPGGGYEMTTDREAEGIAVRFMAMGFHAAVLRYSVKPAVFPVAIRQMATAVRYLREHAKEYYIDADKIITCGFSAGGHLCASYGNLWNTELLKDINGDNNICKPNGQILCYPVITSGKFAHRDSFKYLLGDRYDELCESMSMEKCVNEDTPKSFIWHCYCDDLVPVENALFMATALREHDIETELHIYATGAHGIGTASEFTMSDDGFGVYPECQNWMDLVETWIKHL